MASGGCAMTQQEQEFFKDAGIAVTNARFITNGQTISMAGVTSVTTIKMGLGGAEKLALVFGIILLLGVKSLFVKALALAAIGFGVWGMMNPVFALILVSAAREQRVIADRNKARVFAVAEAVNQALIHRG